MHAGQCRDPCGEGAGRDDDRRRRDAAARRLDAGHAVGVDANGMHAGARDERRATTRRRIRDAARSRGGGREARRQALDVQPPIPGTVARAAHVGREPWPSGPRLVAAQQLDVGQTPLALAFDEPARALQRRICQ